MKISLNYLKQFLDFELPAINKLVDIIGARLGALEDLPVNLSQVYKDVVIVKVITSTPMAGTDHLNHCFIDDGGQVEDVKRNDQGYISVVCGAPNVEAGISAAWLPPGSVVPVTYFGDRLVLETREIKGEISNGMLASPKELNLSDDHEGILIIDSKVNPGESLEKVYELDDYLIDIENKMFTHRPDCFGLLGVAREVSGILGRQFNSPDWYLNPSELEEHQQVELKINNEIPELVPRFSLAVVGNVKIEPSPILIQSYLTRMGIRPINNIVDLTNMVMLETGQPLHAYDYNKLKQLGGEQLTIVVRKPKANEGLRLLSGKEVKPSSETIGIGLNDQLIGLGGVMGGQSTEVDETTTAIVIEAANFNMYSIRRTSMELGVFSEAVTRFIKGQSPLQTLRVLTYAVTRLKELLPDSQVISNIVDDVHLSKELLANDTVHQSVTVSSSFINSRLGTTLSAEEIAGLLTNVEFKVELDGDELIVTTPFWRTDIEIREDVVEEVGRLYGYENIELKFLNRPAIATKVNKDLETKSELRDLLAAAGANELLTYSFVSKKLAEVANQSVDKAYMVVNSISPELNYYRLSVLPSLLNKVHMNIKAGYDRFAMYEIGTYHIEGIYKKEETDLPAEFSSLALVYVSNKPTTNAAYFKAKDYLDYLLDKLNVQDVSYMPLSKVKSLAANLVELAKPFDRNRSALVSIKDRPIGVVGEFDPNLTLRLKLPNHSAGLEVDSSIFNTSQRDSRYAQLSKYPSLKQDITLKIPNHFNYSDIFSCLIAQLDSLIAKSSTYTFTPVSIFRPKDDQSSKHYTFHLVITDHSRTFKDQEVNELLDQLAKAAQDQLNASRV